MSDKFLSEEDLDLANLSWEELLAWWQLWLEQAQATNDLDEHLYSHGVFRVEPGWVETPTGVKRATPAPGVDDHAS
ncbi:MAG: hypothetical protein HZA52_14560 [Planctomycetes bacterium]|nr:hypothetical protein [Planctomycetota bacterium]